MGQENGLTCKQVNEMDIVAWLSAAGIEPVKVRGNDYWYLSPLHSERTASFKVNRKLNRWFDFGEGKGGNLVDLGIRIHGCSVSELLTKLSPGFSFQQPIRPTAPISTEPESIIEVLSVQQLRHPALAQYLASRDIRFSLARQYCNEVTYRNAGKTYFAIGFKNDVGGYELRSRGFKGSSAPKGISHINNGTERIAVFEGFFDFLSYRMLADQWQQKPADFLILNSLSFAQRAQPILSTYREGELYLDNNTAGKVNSQEILQQNKSFVDRSSLYKGYEDINAFLTETNKAAALDRSQVQKRGRSP